MSIVAKTISWVRKYLGEVFEIPPEAIAFVDGKRVSEVKTATTEAERLDEPLSDP